MTRKRTVVAVVLMAVIGATAVMGPVTAQQDDVGDAISVSGSAEYADGTPVSDGTEIVMVINGNEVDNETISGGEGIYGDPNDPNGDRLDTDTSFAGETATFHIGGANNTQAEETYTIPDSQDAPVKNLTFVAGDTATGIELDLSDELDNGDSVTPTVSVTYGDDTTEDVTDEATLSTNDSDVISISGTTVSAESTGFAKVTATARGFDDSVVVEVVSDSGGGNGGGPSPGPGDGDGQEDGAEDEAPPTVTEVRNTLDLAEPTTDTSTEITDSAPDTPGITVTPEGTESVGSVTFDDESVTGSVTITEYTDPPQQIRDDVAASVTDAGAADPGDGGSVNVISVTDITPDNEAAEESSASVTLSVPRDEVTTPERVTIIKETYSEEQQQDTWTQLETTLEEAGDERVTVSAPFESFSLFAVTETAPADDQQQQQDEQVNETDQPDEPADDGGPGIGLIIGLLVVVAIIGAAAYLYSQQE